MTSTTKFVPFVPAEVHRYLVTAIKHWRECLAKTADSEEELIARCYIDAFQSVHMSLFGTTYDAE
jgi:hypothetical protein